VPAAVVEDVDRTVEVARDYISSASYTSTAPPSAMTGQP
jgi:hypothetical protein